MAKANDISGKSTSPTKRPPVLIDKATRNFVLQAQRKTRGIKGPNPIP